MHKSPFYTGSEAFIITFALTDTWRTVSRVKEFKRILSIKPNRKPCKFTVILSKLVTAFAEIKGLAWTRPKLT